MQIRIVTDSTSDIPDEIRRDLSIEVIPLYVNLNGKSYLDIIDLTRKEFFEQLPTAHPHPTTAAPSPTQFMEVYDRLADEGADAIFSIHIAESLSAVFQSARSAAEQYTRIPVHAIDSGNLSMAEGLIVVTAAQAAKAGKSETEIEELLKQTIPNTYAYAKLDTIDYLLRGGRMSSIQHSIVGLLGIKPILKMNNYISKMEVARTRSKAFQRVINVALDVYPHTSHFGITHAANPEQAQELRSLLKERFPEGPDPMVNEVNPALGSHVGPGTVCINYIVKEQLPEPEKKGLLKWFS